MYIAFVQFNNGLAHFKCFFEQLEDFDWESGVLSAYRENQTTNKRTNIDINLDNVSYVEYWETYIKQ